MKYPDIKLGEFEYAALIGSILGGTHIGIDSKGIEARLNFAHCKEQEEYFDNKFEMFKCFGGGTKYYEKEDKRTGKVYCKFTYTSQCNPVLTQLQERFYKDKVKIIPKDIAKDFNDISLAYLFMDDGSHHKNGYYISLCNFTKDELQMFVDMLKDKFDLKCSIHSQRAIYIWKQSVTKFNQLVEPYILPSMQYKLLRS